MAVNAVTLDLSTERRDVIAEHLSAHYTRLATRLLICEQLCCVLDESAQLNANQPFLVFDGSK